MLSSNVKSTSTSSPSSVKDNIKNSDDNSNNNNNNLNSNNKSSTNVNADATVNVNVSDNKNNNNNNKQISQKNILEEKENKQHEILPGVCYLQIKFKLDEDLKLLKTNYENRYAELLKRKFKNLPIDNIDQKEIDKYSITIKQFNTLADGLSGGYSKNNVEKDFLDVDKECLQWTYRGLRLVECILQELPDIICLEECEHIEFLMKYLQPLGYGYQHLRKLQSPVRHLSEELSKLYNKKIELPHDGIALIYNGDKFEISGDVQKIANKELGNAFALAVPLRCKFMNNVEFLAIVTHLKATKTEEGEIAREKEVNVLFDKLLKNEKNLPIILCCDLNATPIVNKHGYQPLCYNTVTGKFKFQSCYCIALGKEPEYTTWKQRKKGTDKHCIDYIFINNGNNGKWKVAGYLEIPQPENNKLPIIPNWHYPSDHFALMTKLFWHDAKM